MSARLVITLGEHFDKWTVIALGRPSTRSGRQQVLCQCRCGKIRDVLAKDLKQGNSTGCLQCRTPARLKHGHMRVGKRSLTYSSWQAMLDRCENPKSPSWQWYGARGVTVCKEWHTFETFLADMGERPARNHTLDRKDNTLPYRPDNCRWATTKEQARNTSGNLLLTSNGRTLPLVTWAEITGISAGSIRSRLRYGWTEEQALSTPPRAHRPYRRIISTSRVGTQPS
jgi:hypothetical protein